MEPARTYRRLSRTIADREFVTKLAAILLLLADESSGLPKTEGVLVTKLERFSEEGQPRVRVCLEDHTEGGSVPWNSFTAILSPADRFAVQSDLIESRRTGTSHGEYLV